MGMFRKIKSYIVNYLKSSSEKILIVDGARQVGKSYIIREAGTELFENYVEINLFEDSLNDRLFENAKTVDDFYLYLSMVAGDRLKSKSDTLVFLDEIQVYPHLLTMLKFLKRDDRFTYIASGSFLGVTLSMCQSIPMGSIEIKHMYPMDFEEFLIASSVGRDVIEAVSLRFKAGQSLDKAMHNKMMDFFRKYLLSGGLPDAVKAYIETKNIIKMRSIQNETHDYYSTDAAKYDKERKLQIKRIYDMIPSTLENKKKRIRFKDIDDKKGKRFSDYMEEFDYLTSSGIALSVQAVSTPVFPLLEHSGKNLIKLYLNDVGILTAILYQNNIKAILNDECGINLGTVYEAVVAEELKAHGHNLFYYDNKTKGEVDFLLNDYENLSVLPIEIKSGKDYRVHSALDAFLSNPDYKIKRGVVLSNERNVYTDDRGITYLPIYYVMFL